MFRILTERKNLDLIEKMLEGRGLDYTVYLSFGSWQGNAEQSMAIELDRVSRGVAEETAQAIKQMNAQEAVLLQEIPATTDLI